MAVKKHSRIFARGVIVAGTILAGIGIWAGVTHAALPSQSNTPAPVAAVIPGTDPNFSAGDTFLTQTGSPQGQYTAQQSPVQTAPAPAPRLRTRGS